VTGILVYSKSPIVPEKKEVSLNRIMVDIPGWKVRAFFPLEPKIASALKLDDYINAIFSNGRKVVSLYIGCYFSDKKLGAAHDPMVCFPGQGWKLSTMDTGLVKMKASTSHTVSFSSMIADKGDQRELVVYWFQSYDKTNTDTFSQKVSSFVKRITRGSQGNAFVRITTPLDSQTREEAQKTIESFIRAFYPLFLKYIKDETRNEPRTING